MKMLRRILLAAVFVCGMGAGVPRPTAAPPDPLLTLLQSEMARNLDALNKESVPPYFVSYGVADQRDTRIQAAFGALVGSADTRSRILMTDVRVGGYDLDNTHQVRGDRLALPRGSANALPLTDDELAIRSVVWRATDRMYRIVRGMLG